jgi:uncharacterized protein (DUF1684 family)
MSTQADWRDRLERDREQKEHYFAEHPHSPLTEDEKAAFEGLDHYPPDPDYRFEVELERFDDPETLVVATSTDGEQEYHRVGRFTVEIAGETVEINAYRGDLDEDRLWVPFRDATSGDETYGAGRYLDLEPDTHRNEDGTWTLDFNEAYNPTCAYSERFECPLPPMENWLDVAVEAGEKVPPGH